MAINKKLISFATQAQFNAFLANGDIDTRSVVFIEDTQRIWSHGKFFDTSWSYITGKPETFTPSAHTLGSHSDVTLTTLASGEILKWNGTNWINNTLAEAGIASVSQLGNYLPLTGGTLTGSIYNILELKRSTAAGSSILFSNSGGNLGKFGFTSDGVLHLGTGSSTDGQGDLMQIVGTTKATTFYGTVTAPTFVGALTGNAATATNISNSGTVTLATATESNAITITQPSYTTSKPVKLLNFNWYASAWSLGIIRGGSTDNEGLGIFLNSVEKFRFQDGIFKIGSDTVYHSGNFNPANYLPLSGGTLSGRLNLTELSLAGNDNRSDGSPWYGLHNYAENGVQLSSYYAVVLATNSNYFKLPFSGNAFLSTGLNTAGNLVVGSIDNYRTVFTQNVAHYNEQTLNLNPWGGNVTINQQTVYHAGNDGHNSGLDADLLDGYHASNILKDLNANYGITITSANDYPTNLLSGIHRTHIVSVEYASILTGYDFINNYWQLRFRPTYGRDIYYRNSSSSSWSTIAFTDSNVASATKLQTPRSLWGQSFDGTGNVSGALTGATTISASGNINSGNDIFAAGVSYAGYGFTVNTSAGTGTGISLYGGSSSINPTYGLMFAQTSYKGTHGAVSGDWATYFTIDTTPNRGWIFTNNSAGTGGNVASISNSGNAVFSGTMTTTAGYKSSDISLKENISLINTKDIDKINLVEFTWKKEKTRDYGAIAQEVEKYYPELINKVDNLKYVNYESLYALKIARLEQRIKELENKIWQN